MGGSGQQNKNTYTLDIAGGESDPSRTQQRTRGGGVHVQLTTMVAVDLGSGDDANDSEEKAVRVRSPAIV